MKNTLAILSLLIASIGFAQDSSFSFPARKKKNIIKPGVITYHEDPRTSKIIDFLVAPMPPDYSTLIDGYRVQIYFNNDKKIIDEQRTKFINSHPDIRTYVRYEAPNYSIKVGNFRTEIQAAKFRNMISGEFPTSIIQTEKIELPNLDESTLKPIEPAN
jgi:hypothetical protein